MAESVNDIKKQIADWALDENEFIVRLVSMNKFDDSSFKRGMELLGTYMSGSEGCVCNEVLSVVCELFLQLSMRVDRLVRNSQLDQANQTMNAIIEVEQVINVG